MSWKPQHDTLYFLPLGGANEIGMNLNLYHYKGKWLLLDFGIGFADERTPGAEVILPNIDFLLERKEDILGLVVTHAHEDHIGAIPYLWQELECPIYATNFCASVLRAKVAGMPGSMKLPITSFDHNASFNLGPFDLAFVPLTHSTAEMHAVAITTDQGTIMHTGDWKFDKDPLIGPISDEKSLERYGKEGVLALVCDSTNVFVEGESGSEATVRQHLIDVVAGCKNRVAITTFASNIARLASAIEAARVNNRRVLLLGRSMHRMVEAAQESGYLDDVPPFVSEKEAQGLPKNKLMILCTGCQGEGRAATARIARNDHPGIRMTPGDTFIFSSREIPGNEKAIGWVQDQLAQQGIDIITSDDHDIHVSGHPCRDELAHMYQLVKPQIAIPVHGEARHIHEHARFARSMQVPEVIEVQNGTVVQLAPGKACQTHQVETGYLAVDGNSIIATNSPVIRMRHKLRDNGTVHATLILDKRRGLVVPAKLSTPGLLDEEDDADLIEDLQGEIADTLAEANRARKDMKALTESIRVSIRRFIKRELSKMPVITVHIAEV